MASLYTAVVEDQVSSATSLIRSSLPSFNLKAATAQVLPKALQFLRKYWFYAVYWVLLRKLYRIVMGSGGRKAITSKKHKHRQSSRHSGRASSSSGGVSSDSQDPVVYTSAQVEGVVPGTNQVLVGDGVVIVNRNDRYVEVYERKNTMKVDNVDEQVEALLKDFSSRKK